jgi:hypothetical protein
MEGAWVPEILWIRHIEQVEKHRTWGWECQLVNTVTVILPPPSGGLGQCVPWASCGEARLRGEQERVLQCHYLEFLGRTQLTMVTQGSTRAAMRQRDRVGHP